MDGWCSELELPLTLCLATCLYLYRLPPPPPLPLIIQVGVGTLFLRYREKGSVQFGCGSRCLRGDYCLLFTRHFVPPHDARSWYSSLWTLPLRHLPCKTGLFPSQVQLIQYIIMARPSSRGGTSPEPNRNPKPF